jgi:hypothetical protein
MNEEFLSLLKLNNVEWLSNQEEQTKITTHSKLWFQLIDKKGHSNPKWKAVLYSMIRSFKSNNNGCPYFGFKKNATKPCDLNCKECKKYTVADDAYILALQKQNIEYFDEIPAIMTSKNCNENRRFRLIKNQGHKNPVWLTTPNDMYTIMFRRKTQNNGCPFPKTSIFPKHVCDPECDVCLPFTLADPH